MKVGLLALLAAFGLIGGGCSAGGCEAYASEFSRDFVENEAQYDVWYWRNLEDDNEDDNRFIGQAVGLKMCQANAEAFAAAVGEEFNYRAYICVLPKDGRREKHRLLST